MLSQGKLYVIKINTTVMVTCFYMSYYEKGGKETTEASQSSCTVSWISAYPFGKKRDKSGFLLHLFFGAFASSNK